MNGADRSNDAYLAEWLTDAEFQVFIMPRPAPIFIRPDFDIGYVNGYGIDFFDVGEPLPGEGWGSWGETS